MENTIVVMGVGDDGRAGLPDAYLQRIAQCGVLVGGERQLEMFHDSPAEKVMIRSGLGELVEQLRNESRSTVVLASGDRCFTASGGIWRRSCPAGSRYCHS